MTKPYMKNNESNSYCVALKFMKPIEQTLT